MPDDDYIKDLDRETHDYYHQDGLLDIFLGAFLVVLYLSVALDVIMMWAIFPALSIPVWRQLKTKVTLPRIGAVTFSADSAKERARLLITFMIVGTIFLGFIMWVLTSGEGIPEWFTSVFVDHFTLVLGAIVIPVTGLFAWMSGLSRFYWYGVGSSVVLVVTYLLFDLKVTEASFCVGAIFIAYGSYLLDIFIRSYDVKEGALDG
jgi:hypothetical protein